MPLPTESMDMLVILCSYALSSRPQYALRKSFGGPQIERRLQFPHSCRRRRRDDPLHSAKILERRGFEARTAADGFAALVELRRSPPDILISDLRMPNMNGFELLSVVRRRFAHIPVIAISGELMALPLRG